MKQHHLDLSLQNLKLDLKGDDLEYVLDVCKGGKQKLFIQGSSNVLTHLATGIFKQNLFEVQYPYEHSYGMPRISFMTWDECMQLMHDFYIEEKRIYSNHISTIKDKFARFDMIIIDQFSVGKKNKFRETMIKQLEEFVQAFEASIILLSSEDQALAGMKIIKINN